MSATTVAWLPPKEVEDAIQLQRTLKVPCGLIRPSPDNPRKSFDPMEMLDLEKDIHSSYQVTPAIVKPIKDKTHQFQLVAGERRWRAARENGGKLLVLVRRYPNPSAELLEMVRENSNRADLSPLENAAVIERLQKTVPQFKKITDSVKRMEAIGQVFGKSGSWASSYLTLLNLPDELKRRMDPRIPTNKRLPVTLGSRLGRLSQAKALEIMKEADERGLDARRTNVLIDQYVGSEGVAEHRKGRKPSGDLRNFEKALALAEHQVGGVLDKARLDPAAFAKMFGAKSNDEVRQYLETTAEIAARWDEVGREIRQVRIMK